jgi:LmbE family N-acetylglucosaminyl deacetylase
MKIILRLSFAWIFIIQSLNIQAQVPATYNSSDIYLQLKKLNVLGSILYIAAHPDDENNPLLPYLAKGKLYRVGYMSLTRGDGGQNLIGDEQGIELGLIRTEELLAARKVDGAEQFFSRAFDFGFTKTADEALRFWGHDKILSDVVLQIRKFKPDIIITRFPADARAGHGQHWASTILANEAFRDAADSSRFPDGFAPWQAKRIMWNNYNFTGSVEKMPNQVQMETGAYNPLLGESYGELGGEARSMHKSQGEGRPRRRGVNYEYFTTTQGDTVVNDIMDGINTTWSRLNGGDAIETKVNAIIAAYNFEHPEKSVEALVALYNEINKLPESYWRNKKLAEVQDIIMECAGIFAETTTSTEYAVQGDSLNVNFFINKRNDAAVQLNDIRINGFDTAYNTALATNKNFSFNKVFTVPMSRQVSQPYWLENAADSGSYNVTDMQQLGNAESNPAYMGVFNFTISGTKFIVTKPLLYKYVDAAKGELYQPVVVITPVIISLSPTVILTNVKAADGFINNPLIQVKYKTNYTEANVKVTVNIIQGTAIVYKKDTVINAEAGKEFTLTVPAKNVVDKKLDPNVRVEVHATINGHSYVFTHYLREISYDHIPHIHYFYRDNIKLVNEEIKTVGKKVGYIMGAGDKVPASLTAMGYEVKLLNENDITENNLAQFDAIVAGVRAYDVNAWLTSKYDVLMNYIQKGGNLIVQYNRNGLISAGKIKVGPYPFAISGTRVTNEKADVKMLLPNHSALNYPNKITQKDFEGWVQERSIYQAENMDTHFETPLVMHDPNENESNGSLAIAAYGKGNFVYTGLVFFRELPAGVSGAYRLMANLIALPQH